jgi:nitroreductase
VTIRELAEARRTHKAFGPEPVPRETLLELLSLARLAPNHHLTQPWRFRVLGPAALARLQETAGPTSHLGRAERERAPRERAPVDTYVEFLD